MGLRMPSTIDQLNALKARKQALLEQGNEAAANSMDEAIASLEAQTNTQPPITAEPTTPDVTGAINEPFQNISPPQSNVKPPLAPPENELPSALATEIPSKPEPAEPSVEPGKTVASQEAKQKDEYEPLFKDYEKAQKEYIAGSEALGKETEETGRQRMMMTGISGALQAFGEGLAAITGGSAKPLQVGAQTVQRLGEQQAAMQEQKAKTLKERLLMARQPLEAKAEDIKFRDLFEQRQKTKRLEDPSSDESARARDLANNFLDAYVTSISNKVDPEQLAKIEGLKPRLQNLSATQIKDFMDNLNKLKFSESKSEIEEAKAEGKKLEARTKREEKQQDTADKEFSTDAKKIVETVDGLKQFQQRIDAFQRDVKLALKGDEEAGKRVVRNQGAVSYLIARQDEPKGVFTEQDYDVLNRLGSGKTWLQQLANWSSQKFTAEATPDALRVLDDVLNELQFTKKDPSEIVKNYKTIYELSDNPFKNEYAKRFDKIVSTAPRELPPTSQPVQPGKPNYEFKDSTEFQKAIPTTKFKVGDIIKIGDEYRKVQANGKAIKIQGP